MFKQWLMDRVNKKVWMDIMNKRNPKKEKNEESGPEYIFHGGCCGCTNTIDICPSCQYMESNWSLPDLNPRNIAQELERGHAMERARAAKKAKG